MNPADTIRDFEKPVVQTRALIRIRFDEKLRTNVDEQFYDTGENLEYYQFDINSIPTYDLREYTKDSDNTYKVSITELPAKIIFQLTKIANAYKWKSDKSLYCILDRMVGIICREKVIGYHVSQKEMLNYVERAFKMSDSMEVEPNCSIRILDNPYFNGSEKSDGINVDLEDDKTILFHYKDSESVKIKRKQRITDFTNRNLGKETKDRTYEAIENAIADYDLNEGLLTQKKIATEVKVSDRSIRNYLKEYPELKEMYDIVRRSTSSTNKKRKQITKVESVEKDTSSESPYEQDYTADLQKAEKRSYNNNKGDFPKSRLDGEAA